ncbi:tetratricopeptide repeat protein [Algicella marina]|uniref:Tetratricopeptide repeat protein 38 n=1 Tax=Algicella marina TaxID=2683284 RepID=A0A6P1T1U8_9RHOB|nr:tetratricopeptide repeat protein [Algicella marina]QHQ36894.1 tetratricopeptide repeat protein [Algicella marina]
MGNRDDFCGCETSLREPDAIAEWNETIKAFLAHSATTPDHLSEVQALAPNFALAHATKGLFCLLLGRSELIETAEEALRTAKELGSENPRESIYILALGHYLSGKPSTAASAFDDLLAQWPEDALAMKFVQAIRFVLGQPNEMRSSLEKIRPAYEGHATLGYLKGCYSFALEETGDYSAAERAGREGLLLAPDDAWGLHAVAHVYDMTARAEEGLFWLSGQTQAWKHCNNFRYHVWWHIALMQLDLGRTEEALQLYDAEIRAEKTDDYRDISNAASLLSRLEVEGVNVGTRWEELAALSEGRIDDGCVVFADLHYILALMGGERKGAMRKMLQRMAEDAVRKETDMHRITSHPGLSAAKGLEAYSEGQFTTALTNLLSARVGLQRIGGSHAQRDVFERLTIEAALRSGCLDTAETMLGERTAKRGGFEDGYTARRRCLLETARADARRTAAPLA